MTDEKFMPNKGDRNLPIIDLVNNFEFTNAIDLAKISSCQDSCVKYRGFFFLLKGKEGLYFLKLSSIIETTLEENIAIA